MTNTQKKSLLLLKKFLARSIRFVPESALTILEKQITLHQGHTKFPPVFIVGPARSGTTLIYQTTVYYLKFSYVSNAMKLFPKVPAVAAKSLSYVNGCNPPNDFMSTYGKTNGWRSPAQGHEIWNRWYPREMINSNDTLLSEPQRESFKGTIAYIEKVYNAPFINKWPGFSVFVQELAAMFPDALFVRITRDYLQNAQSILKGRYELVGNPNVSISRVPKGYEQFKHRSYTEQVCAYLLGIESQLNQDMVELGNDRFFKIKYEDFCNEPVAMVENIRDWYKQKTGSEIEIRNTNIPNSFKISNTLKVKKEEVEALKTCLNSLATEFNINIEKIV